MCGPAAIALYMPGMANVNARTNKANKGEFCIHLREAVKWRAAEGIKIDIFMPIMPY